MRLALSNPRTMVQAGRLCLSREMNESLDFTTAGFVNCCSFTKNSLYRYWVGVTIGVVSTTNQYDCELAD